MWFQICTTLIDKVAGAVVFYEEKYADINCISKLMQCVKSHGAWQCAKFGETYFFSDLTLTNCI